ncbi:MAG: restriction endonuclease subunit S [Campylobacterota bacterium]|nr:restriction endonuclease subunit S [Campylobacterota bacterium]
MIYQIEKQVALKLKNYFEQFDFIDKVVVFGSRARHDCNPKSDIDLCIYSIAMSDREFTKLKYEIDELPILYKIDVVHFEKVNDALKENILRDEKLLFVKKVKLGEVITFINGFAFKSKNFSTNGIPIVRIGNLVNDNIDLSNVVYYQEDNSFNNYEIFKNDILIAMSGATTGKIAYNNLSDKLYLNQRIGVIRVKDTTISSYIFYFLKTNKDNLLSLASGSAQPNLSANLIKNIEIPLPSLEKQKQIAKTLDKAQELITLRKNSIKKLDELSKSIFIDMFGDPFKNTNKYKTKSIKEIGKVQTGNTPPRKDLNNYGDFIEWIKSDNIDRNKLYLDTAKEYLSEQGYEKGRIVPTKSLLFTCIAGSMLSIGNLAIVNREVAFNQQINSITPNEDNIYYLYFLFKMMKRYFEENSTKSMKIMINKSTFEELVFPIAPIDLQNNFAKKIEKIQEQKALYEKELEKLQYNFDALLQKSFES